MELHHPGSLSIYLRKNLLEALILLEICCRHSRKPVANISWDQLQVSRKTVAGALRNFSTTELVLLKQVNDEKKDMPCEVDSMRSLLYEKIFFLSSGEELEAILYDSTN